MDLANAASDGLRFVRATCPCEQEREIAIDHFTPDMAVLDVGLRLRCSACGQKGPVTEPVWPRRNDNT